MSDLYADGVGINYADLWNDDEAHIKYVREFIRRADMVVVKTPGMIEMIPEIGLGELIVTTLGFGRAIHSFQEGRIKMLELHHGHEEADDCGVCKEDPQLYPTLFSVVDEGLRMFREGLEKVNVLLGDFEEVRGND